MKKMINLIIIITIILSSFNIKKQYTKAQNINTTEIIYFGTDKCITCIETEKIMDEILKDVGINKDTITFYNIINPEHEEIFISYLKNNNIPKDKFKIIPTLFINNTVLIGKEDIETHLKDVLVNKATPNLYNENKKIDFNVFTILLGGLVDGVNPCSISMMLFFITFVMMNAKKDKIIKIGLLFSLGTFIAYYGIGLGLLKFIYTLNGIKYLAILLYGSLLFMAVYLAFLNLQDYIAIKKGNFHDIKNQLSSNSKKRIHEYIKKKTTSSTVYWIAFSTGFVISFFEFFCTGQIYLPMISYMARMKINFFSNFMLLGLYNFAFILPLLIITFLIAKGKEVIDISQILVNHLKIIKILGFIFFCIVIFISAKQLLLLW